MPVRETVRLRNGFTGSGRNGSPDMEEQKTSVTTGIAIVDEQTIRDRIYVALVWLLP